MSVYSDLLLFVLFWIVSFMFHEFMHMFEAFRHGCTDAYIHLAKWNKLPSAYCFVVNDSNPTLTYYAGGLYTGVVFIIIGLLMGSPSLLFVFASLGIIQLVYGVFEGLCLSRLTQQMYMDYHYVLYGVLLSCVAIVYIVVFIV